jgi:hypothetical protein
MVWSETSFRPERTFAVGLSMTLCLSERGLRLAATDCPANSAQFASIQTAGRD